MNGLTDDWYDAPVVVDKMKLASVDVKRAGIPARYGEATLELIYKHSPSWYKDILVKVKAYVDGMDGYMKKGIGLMLSGGVGTGKTSLAVAILRHFIDGGGNGMFISCSSLIDSLLSMEKQDRMQFERRLRSVQLLVIDDFGSESSEPWVIQKIEAIILDRYNELRPVIITTNLNQNLQEFTYSKRVIDRLFSSTFFVKVSGESLRPALNKPKGGT